MKHERIPSSGEAVAPPPEINAALAMRKRARRKGQSLNAIAIGNIAPGIRALGLGEALADPAVALGLLLFFRDRQHSPKYIAVARARGLEWIGPEHPPVEQAAADASPASEASADTTSAAPTEQVDDCTQADIDASAPNATTCSEFEAAADGLDAARLDDRAAADLDGKIASRLTCAEATSAPLDGEDIEAPASAATETSPTQGASMRLAASTHSPAPSDAEQAVEDIPGPFLRVTVEPSAQQVNRAPPRVRLPQPRIRPLVGPDSDVPTS